MCVVKVSLHLKDRPPRSWQSTQSEGRFPKGKDDNGDPPMSQEMHLAGSSQAHAPGREEKGLGLERLGFRREGFGLGFRVLGLGFWVQVCGERLEGKVCFSAFRLAWELTVELLQCYRIKSFLFSPIRDGPFSKNRVPVVVLITRVLQ